MKILKFLAITVVIVFLLGIILKWLEKSTKTTIKILSIDKINKTMQVQVMANDSQTALHIFTFSEMFRKIYKANDYNLEVSAAGDIVFLRVLNEQGKEMALRVINIKGTTAPIIIYSE